MEAWVFRLWDEGRQIQKWRQGGMQAVFGEFILVRSEDSLLRKTVLTARLVDPKFPTVDRLPVLVDAAVTDFRNDILHVSGLETPTGKTFAQSWQVAFISK
ncbi:MAG: hypothetical protein Q7T74_07145 [Candidatus Saccharibacteria bacterium]|nr:hypothetical protein [Candidatus Saccharibacteria bacterium]